IDLLADGLVMRVQKERFDVIALRVLEVRPNGPLRIGLVVGRDEEWNVDLAVVLCLAVVLSLLERRRVLPERDGLLDMPVIGGAQRAELLHLWSCVDASQRAGLRARLHGR